jgi:polar amino acid transport system substrate-binding protein
MNRRIAIRTSISRLFLAFASISSYLASSALAQPAAPYELPRFRDTAIAAATPNAESTAVVSLLADADFPPFSFSSQNGPSGIAVELALASCAEANIVCEVTLLPFSGLLAGLEAQQGDVVISGPRIDARSLAAAEPTRPFFRTMGRFAVLSGNPTPRATAPHLDGRRIGTLKGSAYEAWLKTYYGSSDIAPFDSLSEAQEALRTGNIDAVFGDNLGLIYWVSGEASRGCCKLLDNAFSDFDYFSRNMAFLVRKDRGDLTAVFDYGLDQLQANGTTDKVFNRYVPLNPW